MVDDQNIEKDFNSIDDEHFDMKKTTMYDPFIPLMYRQQKKTEKPLHFALLKT